MSWKQEYAFEFNAYQTSGTIRSFSFLYNNRVKENTLPHLFSYVPWESFKGWIVPSGLSNFHKLITEMGEIKKDVLIKDVHLPPTDDSALVESSSFFFRKIDEEEKSRIEHGLFRYLDLKRVNSEHNALLTPIDVFLEPFIDVPSNVRFLSQKSSPITLFVKDVPSNNQLLSSQFHHIAKEIENITGHKGHIYPLYDMIVATFHITSVGRYVDTKVYADFKPIDSIYFEEQVTAKLVPILSNPIQNPIVSKLVPLEAHVSWDFYISHLVKKEGILYEYIPPFKRKRVEADMILNMEFGALKEENISVYTKPTSFWSNFLPSESKGTWESFMLATQNKTKEELYYRIAKKDYVSVEKKNKYKRGKMPVGKTLPATAPSRKTLRLQLSDGYLLSRLTEEKIKAQDMFDYATFVMKRYGEGTITSKMIKAQWEFESIMSAYDHEDLIDIPYRDYQYEKDRPIVMDEKTGEPFYPLGPTNKAEVEIETPITHPFPQWKDVAQKEIWVSTAVYADVVMAFYSLWKSNSFKIGGMKTQKAITFVMKELRNWIRDYTQDNPEHLRVFRMIRWYAEPIIMNLKRTILIRYYSDWVDSLDKGKEFADMSGFAVINGAIESIDANSELTFTMRNAIDGMFEFSYLFKRLSPNSSLKIYVDGKLYKEIWSSALKREKIEVPKGKHTYKIVLADAECGDVLKLSGFKITNVEFLYAETRHEEAEEERPQGHKNIHRLMTELVHYYKQHWGSDKRKGALSIKQRKIWLEHGGK